MKSELHDIKPIEDYIRQGIEIWSRNYREFFSKSDLLTDIMSEVNKLPINVGNLEWDNAKECWEANTLIMNMIIDAIKLSMGGNFIPEHISLLKQLFAFGFESGRKVKRR